MTRTIAATCVLALCGCSLEGAWQPTVSATPGFADGIPREAFADGCRVEWDSLLVGVAGGTLLDEDQLATASLPGDQAVELRGSGGTTLAQIHIPSRPSQSAVQLLLGPPGLVVSSPYDGPCPMDDCGDDGRGAPDNPVRGNASPEQRALLRDESIAGQVSGRLYCGKGTELRFQWDLPQATVACALEHWELEAADSAVTWLDFAFQNLFATAPLEPGEAPEFLGRPWLDADLDGNGVLDPSELIGVSAEALGLPGASTLDAWLDARVQGLVSLSDGTPCSWTEESP